MIRLFTALGAVFLCAASAAAEPSPFSCKPLETVKAEATARTEGLSAWRSLSRDELEFVRGLEILVPGTPNVVPPGDEAIEAHGPEGTVVLFVDGVEACMSISIGEALTKALGMVRRNAVTHSGTDL